MVKIINKILVALAAVIFVVGCQGKEQAIVNQIVGEWHFQGTDSDVQEDIWISFGKDMTFELFQKVGDGAYRSITGRYSVDAQKRTISGLYEDNYPWRYDYVFEVNSDYLTLTAQSDNYSVKYTRKEIPSSVRQMSLPLVKSGFMELQRCL